MNTITKNLIFLLLLSIALVLPACGNQEVKSEKLSETVLKSSTQTSAPPIVFITATTATPTATVIFTPTAITTAVTNASLPETHTYTKQASPVKHHVRLHALKIPMIAAITPLASRVSTPIATPANFTTDNEMTRKKSATHWPLIVAGAALVVALGFYFWTKKAPPHDDFPLPPMGGLSPVGGYTAMRNKVQPEIKKQSIWTKKIF